MHWNDCHAIAQDPQRMSGAWLFAGTRVPVAALFQNLEAGATIDEFVDWFRVLRDSKRSRCCSTRSGTCTRLRDAILFDQGVPAPL